MQVPFWSGLVKLFHILCMVIAWYTCFKTPWYFTMEYYGIFSRGHIEFTGLIDVGPT